MREICTSGSMSGEWKRSMAELVRHRQTKEPEIDRLRLNHRATPRLYLDEHEKGTQPVVFGTIRALHRGGKFLTCPWRACR